MLKKKSKFSSTTEILDRAYQTPLVPCHFLFQQLVLPLGHMLTHALSQQKLRSTAKGLSAKATTMTLQVMGWISKKKNVKMCIKNPRNKSESDPLK